MANYFTVQTTPQWCLYQYHVDIDPEEDSTGVRKALLRVHANTFGGLVLLHTLQLHDFILHLLTIYNTYYRYLFDGTVLYTVKRLHPDPMELYSDRKTDGQRMRILIKVSNCPRI